MGVYIYTHTHPHIDETSARIFLGFTLYMYKLEGGGISTGRQRKRKRHRKKRVSERERESRGTTSERDSRTDRGSCKILSCQRLTIFREPRIGTETSSLDPKSTSLPPTFQSLKYLLAYKNKTKQKKKNTKKQAYRGKGCLTGN